MDSPVAYPVRKNSRYALNRMLDGPHSQSGRYGEVKNLLPLSEILAFLARNLVTSLFPNSAKHRVQLLFMVPTGFQMLKKFISDCGFTQCPSRKVYTILQGFLL